jgi:hypothetical protein
VLVALAVVEQRLALQRVLDRGDADLGVTRRTRRLRRPLQRGERDPPVASGPVW